MRVLRCWHERQGNRPGPSGVTVSVILIIYTICNCGHCVVTAANEASSITTIRHNQHQPTTFAAHPYLYSPYKSSEHIMRDIVRFFRQTYRAVRTDGDRVEEAAAATSSDCDQQQKQQLQQPPIQAHQQQQQQRRQRRPLNRGFSIVDVFFNQPKRGRGPRWPKG